MATGAYDLRFPPDFDTEDWIWTSKGYVVVEVDVEEPTPARYQLTFRDPTRLVQDVEAELADGGIFNEHNLIVVRTVDRLAIERAVEELSKVGFQGLVSE